MKKIIQNIRYVKIIVYLCGMKTIKQNKRMKQTDRTEVVPLLAIIATGVTLSGLILGGATLAAVGAAMYLIPIYIAILGNRFF